MTAEKHKILCYFPLQNEVIFFAFLSCLKIDKTTTTTTTIYWYLENKQKTVVALEKVLLSHQKYDSL